MTNKPSVVFLMHRFAGGGAERVTVLLANELAKRDYDVVFLMRHADGPFLSAVNDAITVVDLNELHEDDSTIGLILALSKAMIRLPNSFLFSVSLGMSVFAVLAKLLSLSRIHLVPIIHNTMSHAEDKSLKNKIRLMRMLDFLVDKTVTVSNAAREDYLHLTNIKPSKVVTIYNPVVSDELLRRLKYSNTPPWPDTNVPVIVAAGRLESQKNYPLMIEAFRLLRRQRDARLIILGEGSQHSEIQRIIDNFGLSQYVKLYGFVDDPYDYFAHADCFLMTSRYEGLPTVMIEALACGCPVVSTDCPSGPREILQNGEYGSLVSMSPQDIADAVSCTLSQPRDPRILRQHALTFSVEKAVGQYIALMSEKKR